MNETELKQLDPKKRISGKIIREFSRREPVKIVKTKSFFEFPKRTLEYISKHKLNFGAILIIILVFLVVFFGKSIFFETSKC